MLLLLWHSPPAVHAVVRSHHDLPSTHMPAVPAMPATQVVVREPVSTVEVVSMQAGLLRVVPSSVPCVCVLVVVVVYVHLCRLFSSSGLVAAGTPVLAVVEAERLPLRILRQLCQTLHSSRHGREVHKSNFFSLYKVHTLHKPELGKYLPNPCFIRVFDTATDEDCARGSIADRLFDVGWRRLGRSPANDRCTAMNDRSLLSVLLKELQGGFLLDKSQETAIFFRHDSHALDGPARDQVAKVSDGCSLRQLANINRAVWRIDFCPPRPFVSCCFLT
mmetsp:Transcript_15896/g.31162  ORF Transcript_15896/g.31162 Transcript_15896/m.31162 type:complete len:276 (-) Transcript_15896:25-852(-)